MNLAFPGLPQEGFSVLLEVAHSRDYHLLINERVSIEVSIFY